MMNRSSLRTTLSVAALTVALGSGSAFAQDTDHSTRYFQGLYLSGAVGAHKTDDAEVDGPGIGVENNTDTGLAGLVGIGKTFDGSNFRGELEVGYRDSDVDSISGVSGSGDVGALTFIGNLFYDFELSESFELYAGGGVGVANVDYDGVAPVGTTSVSESDLGFAWQLGAGAAFALNDRLKATLDYRFLNIESLHYQTSPNVADVDADYRDHGLFVGLRFALSGPTKPMMAAPKPAPVAQAPAPEPAPAPPAAPAPTRNFIVFFDWDQSVITPEAENILREAATTAQTIGPVRIVATGHADRSGTTDYNLGLSERRAAAVQSRLERLGIAASSVATQARGEADPLVPTADGVREPQNRRVEIVLQ